MYSCALAVVFTSLALLPRSSDDAAKGVAAERRFVLRYEATLTDLPAGAQARIWLPVPSDNEHQKVELLKSELPTRPLNTVEPQHRNRMLYVEVRGKGRDVPLQVTYGIQRKEVRGQLRGNLSAASRVRPEELRRWLQPDALVPIAGKPLELLEGVALPEDPLAKAQALYDRVDDHVRYSKEGKGWGKGDVLWVCDSRYGNCSDFHSLFISLARSQGIPARFEIGFPIDATKPEGEITGYHCWAWFHLPQQGWIPVDISEADKHPELKSYYFGNLTPDRVAFSVGRDLNLQPKQAGPPLNYFVYPYVEVDGKPMEREKLKLRFSFKRIGEPSGE